MSENPADRADTAADSRDVVRSCLEALQARQPGDVETALGLLDPDVEWRNSGLPTLRGRRAHEALLSMSRHGIGFEVRIHHLAADGPVVLTDRTDVLTYRRFRTAFWVCGTFEVRAGRIVLWDDHFSTTNFLASSLTGLVRALPGLPGRPRVDGEPLSGSADWGPAEDWSDWAGEPRSHSR